jgi:S-adenosylmethionine:tRNA ribosyltransferase-isomerase
MEEEEFQVSRDVIENLVKTRKEGGRVVAIGTSSTRVIESLPEGCPVQDRKGRTDLFIFPGYRFRWLNAFVTNFHLPKSTPYLLTSAFTGCGALRSVYAEAMRRGYRFYSYGDAMMIL